MNFKQMKNNLFDLFREYGINFESGNMGTDRGGKRSENSCSKFDKKVDRDSFVDEVMEEYEKIGKMLGDGNSYNFGKRINDYLNWYRDNILFHYDSGIQEVEIEKLRNFIEKMAVWYELRYPDYEIDRLMDVEVREDTDIDNVMFYNNPVLKDLLEQHMDLGDEVLENYDKLKWEDFYSTKSFINSLPNYERSYLARVKYPENVTFQFETDDAYFRNLGCITLTSNGLVKEISYILRSYVGCSVIGMKIQDFLGYLKNKGITVGTELKATILKYENEKLSKEELLNCVMYCIIERGGEKYGPRRGYLFAKEFHRDKDVPMMYGASSFADGVREFYQMYLEDGGNIELKCMDPYFGKMITVREVLDREDYYTNHEIALVQRLVNTFANRQAMIRLDEGNKVDIEKKKKEEIQMKRLQRKLSKAKNFKGSN